MQAFKDISHPSVVSIKIKLQDDNIQEIRRRDKVCTVDSEMFVRT